jgi:hypothetical protein
MISPYLKSRQMLRNEIPRVCFYFCSTERNSVHFLFCGMHGLDRNSESLLLFCSTVQKEFSLLRNGSEWNGNSRNSAGTNQLFRLFRLPRNIPRIFVGNCKPYLQGGEEGREGRGGEEWEGEVDAYKKPRRTQENGIQSEVLLN